MADTTVGQKITALREAHQMSVEELAKACGCSVERIKHLEESKDVPSIAPLVMITNALGVRLGTLLDGDDGLGPVYTPAGIEQADSEKKDLKTSSDAGLLTFFSLARGKSGRHMDPFIITIDPSDEVVHKLDGHEGEEFIFVLDGCVEIQYGKEIYVLQEGDSIYYDAIVPHELRAYNHGRARFLAVVYTL